MNTENIISALIGALSGGGLTQLLNIGINRKKGKAAVVSDEIENVRKQVTVYQTIIADLNKRISDLTRENEELRAASRQMQDQITTLQQQYAAIYRAVRHGSMPEEDKRGPQPRNARGQFTRKS